MQKYASVLFALFFIILIAGCGGNTGTPTIVTTLPKTVPLTTTDVSGKTFYITPIDASSLSGYKAYRFNAVGTADVSSTSVLTGAPAFDISGTWSISSAGVLVLTSATTPAVAHQFTCIQKETSYFLMSDESGKISRFYFDIPSALALTSIKAYQDSIATPPPPATPNAVKLGGSIQGKQLASPFTNVTTIAGIPPTTTSTNSGSTDTAPGVAATFSQPTGITTDGTNLYVADYNNNMIRKIVITSGAVTRLAGSAIGAAGNTNSSDGTGNTATFNHPTAITMDGINLYVADANNSIRKIDISSGAVTLIAGSTTGVADSVDAVNGTDARFNQPAGITTDGTNLYVADTGNNTIRKIVISSGAVVTLAGAAKSAGSTDGIGATARFNQPARIATDGSNLYVTDRNNHAIRKIVIATGEVTTIAGTAGSIGSVDGVGTAARFNRPNGITTDGTNLYVTDLNFTIRMIVISSGNVTTLSGIAGSAGHINGLPGSASFDTPIGITTNGISLYVADSGNNTIRKIQ